MEQFLQKHLSLLEFEREAEISETIDYQSSLSPKELERRGLCLMKLRLNSVSTGMYGRHLVHFGTNLNSGACNQQLSAHKFANGDIVAISTSKSAVGADVLATGVVTRVTPSEISIALDDSQSETVLDSDLSYKLIKVANDVTYKRLKCALKELKKTGSHLADVLFQVAEPGPSLSILDDADENVDFFMNKSLNTVQKEAVLFALRQREVAIIHGPPGTGKTTTVVEIIAQLIKSGLKVLVCAPSNIAVDNLVEKLSAIKSVRQVRLGHPARALTNIQKYSLDAILNCRDSAEIGNDIKSEIDQLLKKNAKGSVRKWNEIKQLRQELRLRETAAIGEVLKRADVVLSTMTSSYSDGPIRHLPKEHFDVVVIDECSQALEASCWICLPLAPKCILAGDTKQLQPTIMSSKAAKAGLAITLMERLTTSWADERFDMTRMLTIQYRMHESIMRWSSDRFYQSRLAADCSVAKHLLTDLEGVEETDMTVEPLVFVDTAGCELSELQVPDEQSKGNEGEADLTAYYAECLIKAGVSEQDIAIISPYNLQVEMLRQRLSASYPRLEIKSVDGFQGREKEAVIISMVRSNDKRDIGFLADEKRTNVAVTRARRHLAVIGDSDTLGACSFLKSLCDHLTQEGQLRSAHEFSPAFASQSVTVKQTNADALMSKSSTKETQTAANKSLRDGQRRKLIEKQLEEFIAACECSMDFPSSLNSFERRVVHELCEKMGLHHGSRGTAPNRFINVSKLQSEAISLDLNEVTVSPSIEGNIKLDDVLSREEDCESISSFQVKECFSDDTGITELDQKATRSFANNMPRDSPEITVDSENWTFNGSVCRTCGKEVPLRNLTVHTPRCERIAQMKLKAATGASVASVVQSVPSSERKTKQTVTPIDTDWLPVQKPVAKDRCARGGLLGEQLKSDEVGLKSRSRKKHEQADSSELNDDEVLAMAIRKNTRCNFSGCKAPVSVLGVDCDFCSFRFCIAHALAEVHGCGPAAKNKARKQLRKDGVIYPGSGVPDKKTDHVRRAHLERKLAKKLDEMKPKHGSNS